MQEIRASTQASRRGRKKQRTRGEILSAARRLAVGLPFEALTVEAISEAADVARATFFLHFASKLALRMALEDGLADALSGALDSGRGRSAEQFRVALERLSAWGPIAGDLLQGSLAVREAAPGPLLEVLEGFVRSGQKRGDLRLDLAPERVARVIAGALAALLADGHGGGAGAAEDRLEELLDVLLNGLREPKPRLKWSAPG